jgi:hypothetical protein
MGWARYVAHGMRWGNLIESDHLKDLGADGEDNIKINIKEIGWINMDWISIAQNMDQLTEFCKCDNEFSGSIKLGESLD